MEKAIWNKYSSTHSEEEKLLNSAVVSVIDCYNELKAVISWEPNGQFKDSLNSCLTKLTKVKEDLSESLECCRKNIEVVEEEYNHTGGKDDPDKVTQIGFM